MSRIDRRTLLKGAGIATLAGPWFWVKRAGAAVDPEIPRAKHVLVLYAAGGLRTPALFHADVAYQHNPYGRARADSEWCPGALLELPETSRTLSAGSLPAIGELARDIAVLAGVDHHPRGTDAPIDHQTGDLQLCTAPIGGDRAGLAAIVHRDHPGYRDKSLALPPFDLGRSSFASATGAFSTWRPIGLGSAAELTGRSRGSADAERSTWVRGLESARDAAFLASRPKLARDRLEPFVHAKNVTRAYASLLRHPALDLLGAPDAELGGLSNRLLVEALGAASTSGWGLDCALALRLFQLGVPFVSVARNIFDTHSAEDVTLPADAADLARQLAGLHFLLHHLRDAEGALLWEQTVVTIVSEFGRDNTDPTTGYNSGRGSDHRGSPASRNQTWPIFGGPIAARGRKLGALDPTTLETIDRPAFAIGGVMATLLVLLGIDPAPYYPHAPVRELFR
jgi:hypothetical protein